MDRFFDQSEVNTFLPDTRILNNRPLRWSRDGSVLFFETTNWNLKPPKPDSSQQDSIDTVQLKDAHLFEEAPALQIWHSKDVRVIPEQKQLDDRKRSISHLAAWHVDTDRFVQLGDDLTEETKFQDDTPVILGMDDTPYEFDGMFGRFNSDVYTIDIKDGQKKKILEKVNHIYPLSPGGKTAIYLKEGHYYSYDLQTGKSTNLTQDIAASFVNQDDDHPVTQKPPYGFVGWNKSGTSFLVHSKCDIWQLHVDGSENKNLTKGKADKIIHRYIKVDPEADYVNLGEPVYIQKRGEWSKKSGYAVIKPGKQLNTISWEDVYSSRLIKAKNSGTIAFVAESYHDSPDYFILKNGESKPRQISHTNPFQKEYNWGKAELIEYTNANGRKRSPFC